ncbi:MAG: hypothetical protein DMF56_24520 [Acidobacteria bacterium]|nr:MAG: hypothetical protein DMF56_24520 [Acidobacteriota bacterium]
MKCKCKHPDTGHFPLQGEGFSRRNFLRIAGTGIVASYFADVLDPRLLSAAEVAPNVSLRNSARNCIFIFLSGAPSHVDLWDLKEGSWTPSDFAPTTYGSTRWPQGLMPKTAAHLDKLSIARSGLAWAAVHQLGQTWAQIARNPGGATGAIAPHIGAVVSLEFQLKRTVSDVLPGFIALNSGAIPTSGYLPAKYAPFGVTTASTGLATLNHPDGATRFDRRWDLLHSLDLARTSGALGKPSMDMNDFYDQSRALMKAPGINAIFSFNDADHTRYGATTFGDSLIVARNLVGANKGTRFVQTTLGGWDHHSDIYNKAAAQSIYTQSKQLDDALGALFTDLSTTAGANPGKTLLDETFIVILGEFGRTPGPLTNQGGRDHFLRNSYVFAGGGVKGGRIIGKTDAVGDKVVEYGWSANRDVRPEDVTSSMYSALGIDYTTMRTDDPLGRGFEYVPDAKTGKYGPIEELF